MSRGKSGLVALLLGCCLNAEDRKNDLRNSAADDNNNIHYRASLGYQDSGVEYPPYALIALGVCCLLLKRNRRNV